MKVLWSEAAARRLERIRDHVARFDPAAAHRLVGSLVALGESLRRLPRRGHHLPELPDGDLRELIHGNYRIVYRVTAAAVEVLTVFEGHRPLPDEDIP